MVHKSLSQFSNVENALLYFINFGPQRAAEFRKEMFRRRFGREMMHNDRGWYTSYFRIESPYVVDHPTAGFSPHPHALWGRDNKTMLWSLTPHGEAKAQATLAKLRKGYRQ